MDLDGDGHKDVLSGSWPGEVYWFRGKPNGVYGGAEELRDKTARIIRVGSASAVALADWDADGDLDLVIGTIEGTVFRMMNEGTAQKPIFGPAEPLRAKGRPIKVDSDAGPCLADWDGDGKLDLLLGSGAGGVVWHRNVGTPNKPELDASATLTGTARNNRLEPVSFDNPAGAAMRTKVSVADWNGDGRMDLLVGDFNSRGSKYHGWVWVYLRNGSAKVAAEQ